MWLLAFILPLQSTCDNLVCYSMFPLIIEPISTLFSGVVATLLQAISSRVAHT